MHIIITGGGTGGHIFPALEIAKEFAAQNSHIKITYVGNSNSLEESLAKKSGLAFFGLNTHKIVGQGFLRKLGALFFLGLATLKSSWFLIKNRPLAVVGVGGYVSAPMLIASFILNIRRYICEQNVKPGLANSMLAKIANKIFISFAKSAAYFPKSKFIVSGNPVRKAFFELKPKTYNNNKLELNILVTGGSMGASFMNIYIPKAMSILKESIILM